MSYNFCVMLRAALVLTLGLTLVSLAACSSNAKRVCQSGPKGTQCYTIPDQGPPFPQ